MSKIRNISDHELIIAGPLGGTRWVKPDECTEIPDEWVAAHVQRVDGIPGEFDENGVQKYRTVPSDLWVEVPDIKAAAKAAPAEESK